MTGANIEKRKTAQRPFSGVGFLPLGGRGINPIEPTQRPMFEDLKKKKKKTILYVGVSARECKLAGIIRLYKECGTKL